MVEWLDVFFEMDLPPGVTRDYDTPNVRGITFIVICISFFMISTTFGGIRIYTKAIITRAMGWDDCENSVE